MAKRRGGFDLEFVESPPKIVQSECPVCLLVLCEPYQVTCCGYSYCKACIEQVKADKEPCPCCKNNLFDDYPNKGLQRSLSGFKVYCSHRKEGCQWIGEFGQLEIHLNVNPPQHGQLEGCMYVEGACQFCCKPFMRSQLLEHQSELCPLRPFTCQYCNVFHSHYEDVMNNHVPGCICRPVSCPNECGATVLLKDVDRHIFDDCPLTVVTVQVYRKDLPPHNVLVSACVNKDKLELERLEREIAVIKEQLARRNRSLDQRATGLHASSSVAPLSRSGGALHQTILSNPVRVTLFTFSTFKANDQVWYSPPFHAQGYKFCAAIAANGLSAARNTYVSVFIYLMRGASDSTLRWPFTGIITLQLIDQTGENHITHIIDFTSELCRKAGDRVSWWRSRSSIGVGKYEFVSHHQLGPYLTHDCLDFQVSKIELT